MILSIFTCTSIDQVYAAVDGLVATVESIRASSEDVSRRLANLEAKISGLPQSVVFEFGSLQSINEEYGAPSHREHNGESDFITPCTSPISVVEDDNTSFIDIGLGTGIMVSDEDGERDTDPSSIDTELELLLQGSRAYSQRQWRNSHMSISSCNNSKAGWSCLSRVSISQVTNLSVLSLPISMHELWNEEQYYAGLRTRQFEDFKDERDDFSPPKIREARIRKAWIGRRWLDAKSEGRSRKTTSSSQPISRALDSGMVYRGQGNAFGNPQVKLLLTGTFVFSMQNANVKELDTLTFTYSLTGIQGSGKSTILKQLRFAYAASLITSREKEEAREILVDSAMSAVKAMRRSFETGLRQDLAHEIATNDDFLHAYVKTTGVSETYLESHRLSYRVFDVSGARAERRKWQYPAEDVQCLVFVASLAEYDVHSSDNSSIHESLAVFESLLNHARWFKSSSIVLLLNKIDVLREKVKEIPVRKFWPEYDGSEHTCDAAIQFFTAKFCSLQRPDDSRDICVYCSEATNIETSKTVLQSIEALMVSRVQCSF
ncbi:MAG: hypothetical protein Q9195_002917 [Heterodermia aff. obscurata]